MHHNIVARRLFTLASVLFLVLCSATVVLWVRSRFVADFIYWTGDHSRRHHALLTGTGSIAFLHTSHFEPYWIEPPIDSKHGWRVLPEQPVTPDVQELLDVQTAHVTTFSFWGMGYTGGDIRPEFSVFFHAPVRHVLLAYQYHGLVIPYRLVVVLTGIPPIGHLIGHLRRSSRRTKGLCGSCGYDLRATLHRCPECGSAVPTNQGAVT